MIFYQNVGTTHLCIKPRSGGILVDEIEDSNFSRVAVVFW